MTGTKVKVNAIAVTWVAAYLKLETSMIDRIHMEGLSASLDCYLTDFKI